MTVAAVVAAGFKLEKAPPHKRGWYVCLHGFVIAHCSTPLRAVAHLLLVSSLDPACYPDLQVTK